MMMTFVSCVIIEWMSSSHHVVMQLYVVSVNLHVGQNDALSAKYVSLKYLEQLVHVDTSHIT